jgi:hypothetical protein
MSTGTATEVSMRPVKRRAAIPRPTTQTFASRGALGSRLSLRRRLVVLASAASIVMAAVPVLGSTVSASTMSTVPDGTTYLQLDPQEATVAAGAPQLFTVGAWGDAGFLGDVSGATNSIQVTILNQGPSGPAQNVIVGTGCAYDAAAEAWACGSDTIGDYTVEATYFGGGGYAAVVPGEPSFGTVAPGDATLHVVAGGTPGTGTTTDCVVTPCPITPIVGDPGNPNAVDALGNLVLPPGTDVSVSADFTPGGPVVGNCGSTRPVGDAVDIRVYGTNLGSLTMTTLIIVPKATLTAAGVQRKLAIAFNVCLGAVYLPGNGDATNAWLARGAGRLGNRLVPATGPVIDGTVQRYWGIVAICGTRGLRSTDPCVVLQTKSALILGLVAPWAKAAGLMHDGDLAVLIRTRSPWDGKGGLYS